MPREPDGFPKPANLGRERDRLKQQCGTLTAPHGLSRPSALLEFPQVQAVNEVNAIRLSQSPSGLREPPACYDPPFVSLIEFQRGDYFLNCLVSDAPLVPLCLNGYLSTILSGQQVRTLVACGRSSGNVFKTKFFQKSCQINLEIDA